MSEHDTERGHELPAVKLFKEWENSEALALGDKLMNTAKNSPVVNMYDYMTFTGSREGSTLKYTITFGVGTPPEQTNG